MRHLSPQTMAKKGEASTCISISHSFRPFKIMRSEKLESNSEHVDSDSAYVVDAISDEAGVQLWAFYDPDPITLHPAFPINLTLAPHTPDPGATGFSGISLHHRQSIISTRSGKSSIPLFQGLHETVVPCSYSWVVTKLN